MIPFWKQRDVLLELRSIEVVLPAHEAQEKVIKCVTLIESTITLSKKKLETLQELHQALLFSWKDRDTQTGKFKNEE